MMMILCELEFRKAPLRYSPACKLSVRRHHAQAACTISSVSHGKVSLTRCEASLVLETCERHGRP